MGWPWLIYMHMASRLTASSRAFIFWAEFYAAGTWEGFFAGSRTSATSVHACWQQSPDSAACLLLVAFGGLLCEL